MISKVGLKSPASETFYGASKIISTGLDIGLSQDNAAKYAEIARLFHTDVTVPASFLKLAHPLIRVFPGELYSLRLKVGLLIDPKTSSRVKIAALSTGQYSSPTIS